MHTHTRMRAQQPLTGTDGSSSGNSSSPVRRGGPGDITHTAPATDTAGSGCGSPLGIRVFKVSRKEGAEGSTGTLHAQQQQEQHQHPPPGSSGGGGCGGAGHGHGFVEPGGTAAHGGPGDGAAAVGGAWDAAVVLEQVEDDELVQMVFKDKDLRWRMQQPLLEEEEELRWRMQQPLLEEDLRWRMQQPLLEEEEELRQPQGVELQQACVGKECRSQSYP